MTFWAYSETLSGFLRANFNLGHLKPASSNGVVENGPVVFIKNDKELFMA